MSGISGVKCTFSTSTSAQQQLRLLVEIGKECLKLRGFLSKCAASMVDHRFTFNARLQIRMHQTECVFVYKAGVQCTVTKTYPCCFFRNKSLCWKLSKMGSLDLDLLLYLFFSASELHPTWVLRVKQMLLQKQQRQLQQPLTVGCSSSYPIKTTSKKDIKALGLMPNGLCWPHHSPRAPVVFEDPEWDEPGSFPLFEWKHGQA